MRRGGNIPAPPHEKIMVLPLKKTIFFTVTAVGLVLAGLLCLGARQYALYRDHEQINVQNEKLIFQFAIIREQVTEALLEKSYNRLAGVSAELEKLNVDLSRILANKNIADEYKLGMVNSIDLPSIILLLRKMDGEGTDPGVPRQLNSDIRTLGEKLMLFDRVLVNLARSRLVSFQNIVIGVLSIVVCLITILMLLFNGRIIKPFLRLNTQAKELLAGRREKILVPRGAREVGELTAAFEELFSGKLLALEDARRCRRVTEAVRKTQQAILSSRSRTALFKDVCRTLLGNESYCLVWIGLPDENGTDVLPVSADGSTTMNRKECEICMSVLLTDAEEKGLEYNPAAAALQKRQPVVRRDILADIPKGLLKETPLAAGYAGCAAFPLSWREKVYGVLSIYSTSEESFQPGEMDLLEAVAAEISLVLSLYREREARESAEELLIEALKILKGGMFTISAAGIILKSRRVCEQFGCLEDGVGREWQSVLQPSDPGKFDGNESGDPLPALAETGSVEMLLRAGEIRRPLVCRFVRVAMNGEGDHRYYCIAWDANADLVMAGKRNGNSLQLAALGELSVGMAHEIGDLNNGMINYAQALADELGLETLPPEQRGMLERIFAGGERIAGVVRKLIYYGHETENSNEFKQVQQVLDDALALYGNQLKNDGIQVDVQLPAELPGVQVRAQKMLVVFLQLLGNARRSLNKRYPQRDAGKRLEVRGEVMGEEKQQQLALLLTDHGSGLHPEDLARIFDPDFFPRTAGGWGGQSLALGREIVGKHGGTISLESEPDNFTTVRLGFPT